MTLITIEQSTLIELVKSSLILSSLEFAGFDNEESSKEVEEITEEKILKQIQYLTKPNRKLELNSLWQHNIKRGVYSIAGVAHRSTDTLGQKLGTFKLHGKFRSEVDVFNQLELFSSGYTNSAGFKSLTEKLVFYKSLKTNEGWALTVEEFLGLGKDNKNRFNKLQEII